MNVTTLGKRKKKKKGRAELLGAFLRRKEEHHMLRHISFFLLRFQRHAAAAASTRGRPGGRHQQHPMDLLSRESGHFSRPFCLSTATPFLSQISLSFSER